MRSEPFSAKSRQSTDRDSSPRAESASTKCGSGGQREYASEEVQGEKESPKSKKKEATRERKPANAGRKSLSSLAEETDQDSDNTLSNGHEVPQPSYTTSKVVTSFAGLKSWEDKVESVKTVEHVGDDLMVYFVT